MAAHRIEANKYECVKRVSVYGYMRTIQCWCVHVHVCVCVMVSTNFKHTIYCQAVAAIQAQTKTHVCSHFRMLKCQNLNSYCALVVLRVYTLQHRHAVQRQNDWRIIYNRLIFLSLFFSNNKRIKSINFIGFIETF